MAQNPLGTTKNRLASIVSLHALLLSLCIGGCQRHNETVIYDHGKQTGVGGERGDQLAARVIELARSKVGVGDSGGGIGPMISYLRNHGLVIEVRLPDGKAFRRGGPNAIDVEYLMLVLSHPVDASTCEPPMVLFGGQLPWMIRMAAWATGDALNQPDDLGRFYFSSFSVQPNVDDLRKTVAEFLYGREVAAYFGNFARD